MKKIFLLTVILLFILGDSALFAKPKKKAKKPDSGAPVEYEENTEFSEADFELGEALKQTEGIAPADLPENNVVAGDAGNTSAGNAAGNMSGAADAGNAVAAVEAPVQGQALDGQEQPALSEEAAGEDLQSVAEAGEAGAENPNDLDNVGNPEEYLCEDYGDFLNNGKGNRNLLNVSHRFFQLGFKAEAGVSNNFFNIKDFLKKELEIDLQEISKDMPDSGWSFDVLGNSELYVGFALPNNLIFNISTGVEASGKAVVSKELFDYIGDGFKLYEPLSIGGDVSFDSFGYAEVDVGFDLFGFHVCVTPAFVRPLVHVETENANISYYNPSDGSISVSALAKLKYYGFTDLEPILEDGDFSEISSDAWLGWGFDLGLSVEHRIFNTLQGGAYIRIPCVPGHLTYSADVVSSYNFYLPGFKEMINGDYDDPEYQEFEKTYGTEEKYLSRPFRTGLQLAWRPFGRWCTFGASGGYSVKYMFTEQAKGYFEYDLSCEARFFHMIGTWVKTQYLNEMFKHEAGLILNFRVFELNVGASLQGADFVNSLKGSGAGAFVNFAIGF